MDLEDDIPQVSFVIECTEEVAHCSAKDMPQDPAKARQKLLDKCVGTPKEKALCKSFKEMCDFAKGPLHALPSGVKTHLGGV
jgi:hypothetical protein